MPGLAGRAVLAKPAAAGGGFAKAGTFRSRSTTGLDTVSGLSFTPKAAFLVVQSADFSDTTLAPEIVHCHGFSDGTTSRFMGIRDDDAATTSQTARCWTSTIRTVNTSAATTIEGTVALTSDGFTIDWTTISGACSVAWWVIGGQGVSAKVLLFNRATTGSAGVTGAGFQPKALIGLGTSTADAPTAANADAFAMLGFADDDADEVGIGTSHNDAVGAANTSRIYSQSAFLARRDASNSADDTVISITSLDSDGFTYNASTHPASSRFYAVLCLGGTGIAASDIVHLTADSTTGAHTQTMTGFPFDPDAGLALGASTAATGGAVTADATIGAFDSTLSQWSMLYHSIDAADPMEADEGGSSTSVLSAYASADGAYDAVGNITAKDSDSIDIGWDAGKIATQFLWSMLVLDLN